MVLAVSGCGSTAESSAGAAPPSPDPAAVAINSLAAPPPSPRDAAPSASPSPTADKARKAATPKPRTPKKTGTPSGGGSKYPECADGDCKVSFSGSVTFPLRKWTVSASVEDGGVRVRLTKPNGLGGGGAFLAGPGCSVALHTDGGGRVGCDKPQDKAQPGGYVVHVLKLNGGRAAIRATLG
jgi:hypothetical protein